MATVVVNERQQPPRLVLWSRDHLSRLVGLCLRFAVVLFGGRWHALSGFELLVLVSAFGIVLLPCLLLVWRDFDQYIDFDIA